MPVMTTNSLQGYLGRTLLQIGNRYQVRIPNLRGIDGQALNFMCTRATLPGKQVLSTDRRIGPTFQKIAYGYAVEDISLSFYMTRESNLKKIFEDWQQLAMPTPASGFHTPEYKNNYVKDVEIDVLGKNGFPHHRVRLIDAYPTTVNGIEFSNDNEQPVEVTVQLSYMRWEIRKAYKKTLTE